MKRKLVVLLTTALVVMSIAIPVSASSAQPPIQTFNHGAGYDL
ncbi:hypothetical protein SAMN05661091_4959 [Paenibacillus uliginis N3/975]|uniref:Uncharacterized protein n=1 Tax=Paenibacillus uliginis N3/975 TaxID=1313296 RepID=A0A1X7HP31_9BACL|nr:hypothetical protein [Paenibacillus uliginis]SMF90285.1 hypothetical protein SAMN05661091_4959 [Paenibacillus uliginis N3/975]